MWIAVVLFINSFLWFLFQVNITGVILLTKASVSVDFYCRLHRCCFVSFFHANICDHVIIIALREVTRTTTLFIVSISTNFELKHACHDINPPQHIGFQNKYRREIISPYFTIKCMPPIQYSAQQLINFSATQREIHNETPNSKNLLWQSKNKTITISSDNFQVKCVSL